MQSVFVCVYSSESVVIWICFPTYLSIYCLFAHPTTYISKHLSIHLTPLYVSICMYRGYLSSHVTNRTVSWGFQLSGRVMYGNVC